MSQLDVVLKRIFDILLALVGLLATWPVILLCTVIASRDTRASGIFSQKRIGQGGKPFYVYKIRTMRAINGTTVTTTADARITRSGAVFRRYKLDELPQLWNVLTGDMSFVGPRPDVPGFADRLEGDDRALLQLRPGITGPASLKYRDEECLLSAQSNPELYNREVIWPDKVAINIAYLEQYSFLKDIIILIRTVTGT